MVALALPGKTQENVSSVPTIFLSLLSLNLKGFFTFLFVDKSSGFNEVYREQLSRRGFTYKGQQFWSSQTTTSRSFVRQRIYIFFLLPIYFVSSSLEFNPVEAAVFSLPMKPQDYA